MAVDNACITHVVSTGLCFVFRRCFYLLSVFCFFDEYSEQAVVMGVYPSLPWYMHAHLEVGVYRAEGSFGVLSLLVVFSWNFANSRFRRRRSLSPPPPRVLNRRTCLALACIPRVYHWDKDRRYVRARWNTTGIFFNVMMRASTNPFFLCSRRYHPKYIPWYSKGPPISRYPSIRRYHDIRRSQSLGASGELCSEPGMS